MKKKIIISLVFLFCAIFSFAQTPYPNRFPGVGNDSSLYTIKGTTIFGDGTIITRYADTLDANKKHIAYYPGAHIIVGNTEYIRDSTGTKWLVSSAGIIPAGAITTIPVVGSNPGSNLSSSDWIINTFYGAQPPTATLSGGATLPYQSTATLSYTLNYTAGRESNTKPISTIVVAGNNESFSQPAQGSSVSGTQNVSVPTNTNVTFQNIVTTTDGQTAVASVTYAFLPYRYYGFISDTTGIGTFGFDDSQITSLGHELSASKSKSFSTGNPTGTQFLVYAYYSTAGALTQFDMNGFPSLAAMNSATRNLTTAEGFVGQWIIYWSKNGQTLSSTIVAN